MLKWSSLNLWPAVEEERGIKRKEEWERKQRREEERQMSQVKAATYNHLGPFSAHATARHTGNTRRHELNSFQERCRKLAATAFNIWDSP